MFSVVRSHIIIRKEALEFCFGVLHTSAVKRLSKKEKLRQLRTQLRREEQATARTFAVSTENRAGKSFLNPRVESYPALGGETSIPLPERMNLENDRSETLQALKRIQRTIVKTAYNKVVLDLSKLKSITFETAVLLVAEIDRAFPYRGGKEIAGNHPTDQEVCTTLSEIGYFEYFQTAAPEFKPSKRIYLKLQSGFTTDGPIVGALIKIFEKRMRFSEESSKLLYRAIVECLDNVAQHAYRKKTKLPYIRGKWWMVGYCDYDTDTVGFCLLDQGVGIAKTIREVWRIRLKGIIQGLSDAEIVREAVRSGSSRFQNVRRGNGLKSLLKFVENAPDGCLKIQSLRGNNCFYRSENIADDALPVLEGTLISWVLKPESLASLSSR